MQRWVAILLVSAALVGCLGEDGTGDVEPQTVEDLNGTADETVAHFGPDGEPLNGSIPDQVGEAVWNLTGYQGAEPTMGITTSGAIFAAADDVLVRSTDKGASWEVVTDIGEDTDAVPGGNLHGSWDPLMYVDDVTDAVYFDPMFPPLACTELQVSTDDGDSWEPRPPACHPPPMDHQKFFTALPGPDAPGQAGAAHDTVLYQCYNALYTTNCAVSYDDGYSWPVAEPVGNSITGNCGGINGFGEGSPEGVAVVPLQSGCEQATIAVSTDSGLSWELRKVPEDTGVASFDPEVDFDGEGNLYLVWRADDERSYLAVSEDLGGSWEGPWEITPPAVESTIFNTITVTDRGDVAVSFLGTEDTDEGPNDAPANASWHLYNVVSLADGVEEPRFTSHQVTPEEDPVHVGQICTGGIGCDGNRNLLEFIDNAVHPDGTLYTIYTEGCVEECTQAPSEDASDAQEIAWARLDGVTFGTNATAEQGDDDGTATSPLAAPVTR